MIARVIIATSNSFTIRFSSLTFPDIVLFVQSLVRVRAALGRVEETWLTGTGEKGRHF
jgi:hypothetical protein